MEDKQLHSGTEKRLRDVLRQIDDGLGGGFTFPHWLSNSESMEAAKYFVTGLRHDCASLWYAQTGVADSSTCLRLACTLEPLQGKRYAELADALESHINNNTKESNADLTGNQKPEKEVDHV